MQPSTTQHFSITYLRLSSISCYTTGSQRPHRCCPLANKLENIKLQTSLGNGHDLQNCLFQWGPDPHQVHGSLGQPKFNMPHLSLCSPETMPYSCPHVTSYQWSVIATDQYVLILTLYHWYITTFTVYMNNHLQIIPATCELHDLQSTAFSFSFLLNHEISLIFQKELFHVVLLSPKQTLRG